jgi:hypothetical protein
MSSARTLRAKRPASTSSVRAWISSGECVRPLPAWVIANVRVASVTKSMASPMSDPTRAVVSHHCSVRMPAMTRWSMKRRRSHRSSPVSVNALWVCFSNTASAARANQSSGLTTPDSRVNGPARPT